MTTLLKQSYMEDRNMININDKNRVGRKLIARHSLGNGKSEGGWVTYHFCGFKFRIRTRKGLNYTVPTCVYRWLNVSNNVTTAPPQTVTQNRIGTLNEQLSYWKGQKVYLSEVASCVT